jgi:ABC-type polysaccharide/polyol phosphate transport system ATPase subunit
MIRIQATSITKTFDIGFTKRRGFLNRLASMFSRTGTTKRITVLDAISLEVAAGEVVGIVGTNGSGKSTLLRIIAGIYQAQNGTMTTAGNIISIINLGVGLKERLTMKENIYLVGSLFGMSSRTITTRLDSIVAFSELPDFINTKLYQFSAGMIQRLAFSIAIHANPDILILDEVFEVGDEHFKKKSAEKIRTLVQNGSSVVLVSHDLAILGKNCDRIIWLSHGKIKKEGPVHSVLAAYNEETD